jgi:PAS domain-containing protein
MRFLENINQNVSGDFLPRRYYRPLKRLLPLLLLGAVGTCVIALFHESLGIDAVIALTILLTLALCALSFYHLQQSNDLVMASDFQNLLFANAAAIGTHFCFFLRRDGTIIYANDGTRSMFPNFVKEQVGALEILFQEAHVSKEDSAKFYSALTRGVKENLVFRLTLPSGEARDFIVVIHPLPRPSGYFVVHGRSYYQARHGKELLPGTLAATDLTKLEALLGELPLGVYLTSATGIVEYVNPVFEQALGYEMGTYAKRLDPVHQLVYHADGFETGEFGLNNYNGSAMLMGAHQRLVPVHLKQQRIMGANGNMLGVMGIVSNMTAT